MGLPKTLDFQRNNILPREGFWVRFIDGAEIICCAGLRYVQTKDFTQFYLQNGRLFGDRVPVLRPMKMEFVEKPDVTISGRVGFIGGARVTYDWRKRGLHIFVSKIARALAMRDMELDFNTGFTVIKGPMGKTASRMKRDLGWANSIHLASGVYPGTGECTNIQLSYESAAEFRRLCILEQDSTKK